MVSSEALTLSFKLPYDSSLLNGLDIYVTNSVSVKDQSSNISDVMKPIKNVIIKKIITFHRRSNLIKRIMID